jgi:large conductance mechanosensitive channel
MSIVKEFKEFAMRGNILMPPIGMAIGRVDVKDFKLVLQKAAPAVTEGSQVVKQAVNEVALKYGMFIQTIIDFLIVAFCIFLVVKVMNRLKQKEEAKPVAPAPPSKEEILLTEIRDLLKEKK